MKRAGKIILAAVMSIACLFGTASEAQAGSYAGINLEDGKTCTAETVLVDQDTYNQTEPVYVQGAELSLVKVADLNTDGTYTLLSDFDGLDGWDAYIGGSGTSSDAQTAANAAQDIAVAKGIAAADKQTTGADGKAKLTADSYGIYLLYESGQETGTTAVKYFEMNPVLVQMPLLQDNQWVYDQTLKPKMVINTGTSIKIRKRAQQDGKVTDTQVIGAELAIVSADDESKVLDQWTTSTVDHDSVLLKPGKYILKETKVPDGYEQASPISFEMKADGTIVIDGTEQSAAEIVMPDPVKVTTPAPTPQNPSVVQKITNMVKTGDTAQIALWSIMAAAALCIVIALIVRRKKQQNK